MAHPAFLILLTLGGVYFGKLWLDDLNAARAGGPRPHALPGATPCSRRAVGIAVFGAVAILALETAGEHVLGIAGEQSRITWLFAVFTVLAAPIIEEIVFRGWLVPSRQSRAVQIAAVLAASVLFAVLHPFLWKWDDTGFAFTPTPKDAFSSIVVFGTSLWFYAARLGPWNPTRSLLPCFAAHAAKNFGVVIVKAAEGYVGS